MKARNLAVSLLTITAIFALANFFNVSYAGEPEYMKLDFKVVKAVEIKGYWDSSGVFIATDIERLPNPRRPKLRGEITDINLEKQTITMYGIDIEVDKQTQFIEPGDREISLESLKIGQRVEISCNIDKDDGEWEARKIRTRGIKDSDKIKGTISKFHIDGKAPDTLEIDGLMIILDEKTDVDEPSSFIKEIENDLFEDMLQSDVRYEDNVKLLGGNFYLAADYRTTVRSETEFDLSQSLDSDYRNMEPELRIELSHYSNDSFGLYGKMRFRKKYNFNTHRIDPPSQDPSLQLIQLYLLLKDLGIPGFAVQTGRQDFDEPREWLFDEYLDAVRIFYYGRAPFLLESAIIHAVSPLKDKYKSWTDIFAQGRYYLNDHSFVRGYILSRSDSGIDRNREPLWLGVGFYGKFNNTIRPWLETSIMRGEDKFKTQKASAVDAGITLIANNILLTPALSIGYAYGSGDKASGDGESNNFRQTSYEDNTAYLGGVTTVKYYGELLDPELSNLIIFTAAVGFRPIENGSVEIIYHKYEQDRPDDKLKVELVDPPARPNGIDTELGWEIDFVLGISNLWGRVAFSWIYSLFKPGEAFAPYQEYASLNKFNLKIEI
jgi:alginate production protein